MYKRQLLNNMKRIFLLILLSLLFAGEIYSQNNIQSSIKERHNHSPKQRVPQTDHGPVGINISLWKNISTQRTDTIGSTCFNLGIFSSMNRLNGLGMNVLSGVVGRDMNGMQMAGIDVYKRQLHALGWHHKIDIEEGVQRMYDWYMNE